MGSVEYVLHSYVVRMHVHALVAAYACMSNEYTNARVVIKLLDANWLLIIYFYIE